MHHYSIVMFMLRKAFITFFLVTRSRLFVDAISAARVTSVYINSSVRLSSSSNTPRVTTGMFARHALRFTPRVRRIRFEDDLRILLAFVFAMILSDMQGNSLSLRFKVYHNGSSQISRCTEFSISPRIWFLPHHVRRSKNFEIHARAQSSSLRLQRRQSHRLAPQPRSLPFIYPHSLVVERISYNALNPQE